MELLEEFERVSLTLTEEEEEFRILSKSKNTSYLGFDYGETYHSEINTSAYLDAEDNFPLGFYDGNSTSSMVASVYGNFTTLSPSYAMYERFMVESRHWVQRVLVPLVMCMGVIGNSVSMVVLTRRKMRSSTNNYLTGLAISDLLYLVFVFSLSLQHHPDIKQPRHWFYWQYFRYGLWFTDASSSTSIWLTVTFTIERYIAISHPIKGKVLCTVSRAKKVVLVVYLLCWVLTATTPHEWVVVTRFNSKTNQPYLSLDYSRLGQDSTYKHTYYWFTAVTFILLPLFLLVVFNWFLIQAVRRSKFQRRKMTMVSERDHYSHQQEHKITVMLIAVVILALICQMPTAILLLYSTVSEPPPKTKAYAIMRGLGNIFNLLNATNAAANFILYSAFSDKYRRTFLITFVPCFYHQQPLSHSFVTSLDSRRPTIDSSSIRSISRRVSKGSATPPMGVNQSPRMMKAGSFKENGVGSLDARVTLQYGFGRVKRSMTLSPNDAYTKVKNSDYGSSPNFSHTSKRRNTYSPNVRCRRDLQCFDFISYDKPSGYGSDANIHSPASCDGRKLGKISEGETRKDGDILTVERLPPDSANISEDQNDPMHFKFIDEECLDGSCFSPVSFSTKPTLRFTFSEESAGSSQLQMIGASSESTGSCSLYARSPGSSTLKSSSTILSPD